MSHPKLNYYAIVLQISSYFFNTMLFEWHFLKYANYKDVEGKKKVELLTFIQSMFQGLRVLDNFNYPN